MTNIEALKIKQKIERKLLVINQAISLRELEISGEQDMPVSPAVAALIAEFDTATDAIAARIQKLINASTSLSAEDSAALQSEVDKLTALGKDTEVPPVA